MEKTYEVFISCKSQDYIIGQAVYNFLTSHNIKTFFAPVSLGKEGNAEYGSLIDETIDEVTHFIVVTSNPEYVKTQWVKHEWNLFLREKNSGRKKGNLLTVLKGIEPSSLHISLRNLQSIDINDMEGQLLSFLPLERDMSDATNAAGTHEENDLQNVTAYERYFEKLFFEIKNASIYTLLEKEDYISSIEANQRVYHGATLYIKSYQNYLRANKLPVFNPCTCKIENCLPYCLPQNLHRMKEDVRRSFIFLKDTFNNIGFNLMNIIEDYEALLDAAEEMGYDEKLQILFLSYVETMFEIDGLEELNNQIMNWMDSHDYQALSDHLNNIAKELYSNGIIHGPAILYTPKTIENIMSNCANKLL